MGAWDVGGGILGFGGWCFGVGLRWHGRPRMAWLESGEIWGEAGDGEL